MITITDLGLAFSGKKLFDNVNLKFTPGNCYGVIGANGAGKTTFTRILSGELEPTNGTVSITPGGLPWLGQVGGLPWLGQVGRLALAGAGGEVCLSLWQVLMANYYNYILKLTFM